MRKIFLILIILIFSLFFTNALTIQEVNQGTEKSPVLFFKTTTCPNCAYVDYWLSEFESEFENVIVYRIIANEEQELLMQAYDLFDVPTEQRQKVPIVFFADKVLFGKDQIINELKNEMILLNNQKIELEGKNEITDEMNLWYVLGLAGVDAINPCELAVLILLMTAILSRYPKEKKKALKAGLLFSLAIFLMYFIFGLIIIFGFTTAAFLTGFNTSWFILALSIFAIILGLLNIKDAVWYGGGGFIMEVPQKWRPKMKEIIQGTTSPKGAFFVGLIVSFFLTPCTAGPYFVFGGILSTVPLTTAVPYMLIYMLIFISPMVLITLFTYFGFAEVENMSSWREKNLKNLHLVAGIIMILMGIIMILWSLGII